MDWTHLFVSNEDLGGGNVTGALDTDPSLLVATSDFFENLPFPPTSIPPRPPSIPADLEPAPLFPPNSDSSNALEAAFLSAQQPYSTSSNNNNSNNGSNNINNSLGLRFDGGGAAFSGAQLGYQQEQGGGHQAGSNTLFDSKEESYLNSFLSGFDIDGLDMPAFFGSPLPMPNLSARTDFSSIGMGMGIGAGMIGGMDDAVPHLSIDSGRGDAGSGLTHMAQSAAGIGGTHSRRTVAAMPMRRQASMFDYGMGSNSSAGQLSAGNAMSEEIHKVSSWLLQNQDHHGEAPQPQSATLSDIAAQSQRMGVDMQQPSQYYQQQQQHRLGALGLTMPASLSQSTHAGTGGYGWTSMQSPRPPSESDMSVKRKASFEQMEQPRKTRGSMRSPIRETQSPFGANSADGIYLALSRPAAILEAVSTGSIAGRRSIAHAAGVVGANSRRSVHPGVAGAEDAAEDGSGALDVGEDEDGSGEGEAAGARGGKRRDKKKGAVRAVLTEEERRANHIASEQRRRNQIRHGYAELMTLVTTLRDPALGNHPGTAQSTPSKAVILAHAVQFIRGLEEGNRMLRKRLEKSHSLLPPPPPMHGLSAFRPSSSPHQQQQQ
ncbi:hypothetical protein EV175_003678 [Coemansia sp. RSA 1933]|nr:hypothetical protein EV175_003678 [Coemansia sp. RSA 1933]